MQPLGPLTGGGGQGCGKLSFKTSIYDSNENLVQKYGKTIQNTKYQKSQILEQKLSKYRPNIAQNRPKSLLVNVFSVSYYT